MLLTLLSSLLAGVPIVGSLVGSLAKTVNSLLFGIPILGGLLAGLI